MHGLQLFADLWALLVITHLLGLYILAFVGGDTVIVPIECVESVSLFLLVFQFLLTVLLRQS